MVEDSVFMLKSITVHGARQHNLRNVSVEIPRNSFTVITGLSGSGKSSLAFDTIYAEGQRRYVETLSRMRANFSTRWSGPTSIPSMALARRSLLSKRRRRGARARRWEQ